jgi:hypothetical protein
MPTFAYSLEVSTAGFVADVTLNGWPAARARKAIGRTKLQLLNPWLFEGDNRLEVTLSLHEDRGVVPAFDLTMAKHPFGEDVQDEHVLVRYRWLPALSPLQDEGPTLVFSHTMPVRSAFGRWSWQGATPFMPKDRADVEALVARVHATYARGDVDGFIDLMRVKIEELSRATGDSPDALVDQYRDYYRERFSKPDFRVKPLEPDLVLESSAGGRLVDVRGPFDAPTIIDGAGGEPSAVELTVSFIQGEWRVVR